MEPFYDEDFYLIPSIMIKLYSSGAFPMADSKDGELKWYYPEKRTIIPLDDYNIPRSLRKFVDKAEFEYRVDKDYLGVIRNCAKRDNTWITEKLINGYVNLFEMGHLHTVEVYQGGQLVGGLYGISYLGAFFGESMFSKVSQASKCALVKLIEILVKNEWWILDVQLMTEHLRMFGAIEISLAKYKRLLHKAYTIQREYRFSI